MSGAVTRSTGNPCRRRRPKRRRWTAGTLAWSLSVAGLSVVGALLAWWASSEFSTASSTSLQAVQEAAQYLTVKAEQDSYVSFGERLAATYQEHTVAESEL